jgi:hypothetical protein
MDMRRGWGRVLAVSLLLLLLGAVMAPVRGGIAPRAEAAAGASSGRPSMALIDPSRWPTTVQPMPWFQFATGAAGDRAVSDPLRMGRLAPPSRSLVQEPPPDSDYLIFLPLVQMPRTRPDLPNIVVIGWDGLQRDHFWQCYNRELPECPDGLANIQALSGGQIYNNTTTNGATSTKPGWAQIFTGYDAEVTGVFTLEKYRPIPVGYTVFEKIEDHFGADNVVTMFISGKGVHTGGACVGDPTEKDGEPVIEDQGQPWCLTKVYLDYYELDQVQNEAVASRALDLLEAHQRDLFFAAFIFHDPDVTGHLAGENSASYSRAIVDDDYWLGRIVAKLHALGLYERTLVYVVTDHGFGEGKYSHLNAPYGILATNDPLVVRSGDRKDIGPTFLERYGISPGPIGNAPAVNGYSLYSFPPWPSILAGQAYVDYPGAPNCSSGLQLVGLDKYFGGCIRPTGGTGDSSGYCTDCGNGVCQAPENRCNCPVDCRN